MIADLSTHDFGDERDDGFPPLLSYEGPIPTVPGNGAELVFFENLGQLGTAGGILYAIGDPLSIAFFADHISVVARGLGGMGAPSVVAYEVRFVGARPVVPQGSDPVGTTYNFLLGNDPDRWISGAAGYGTVAYHGLWDGVDLAYHSEGSHIK